MTSCPPTALTQILISSCTTGLGSGIPRGLRHDHVEQCKRYATFSQASQLHSARPVSKCSCPVHALCQSCGWRCYDDQRHGHAFEGCGDHWLHPSRKYRYRHPHLAQQERQDRRGVHVCVSHTSEATEPAWQRQCLPIDAERLGFFLDDGAQNETPYVTLVAELAAKPPAKCRGNVVHGENPVHTSARHPRYSIRAYECTHKTWNVVRAAECDC